MSRAARRPVVVRRLLLLLPPLVAVVSAAVQATQAGVAEWLGLAPPDVAGSSWLTVFAFSLPTWLLFGVLFYPAYWLTARAPFGRDGLLRPLAVHTVGGLAFAAAFVTLAAAMRYLLFLQGTGPTFQGVLAGYVQSSTNVALLLYWGIVGTWSALSTHREARQREVAAARLEALWANARLEKLRLQLRPHFLLNALNAIGTRALNAGARETAREVSVLGDFLRAQLRMGEHVVPLEEDLRLLRLYLRLQELRLEDRLRVDMDIDEEALPLPVPVLTLHTLVENAIRHAVEPSERGGEIRIRGALRAGRLVVIVTDSGGPEPTRTGGHGIGLNSLGVRARELFGPSAELELKRDAAGTRVTLELPTRALHRIDGLTGDPTDMGSGAMAAGA